MVSQMFELMYEANGVGLAANQVDLPLRLFVVNTAAKPGEGEELVFINPVLSKPKGNEESEEGCLSLPGIYGNVRRPKQIHVNAYSMRGEEISADLTGLLARVVQHETDHLDGVLFIDRMTESAQRTLEGPLEEFQMEFQQRQQEGSIAAERAILERLSGLEKQYC